MTVIAISSFLGENRAAEPKLIQDGQGTVSLNQKPGRGDLRPWREPAQVFTAPDGTKTIYRMGRGVASDTLYWLAWPHVVHTALGFDAEDTTERTAYTGDGAPKVTDNLALSAAQPTTNPTASRPLGLPAPDTALTANVVLPAPDPDEGEAAAATVTDPKKRVVADYFYVYTYVNDWGWESAPSPVSAAVERTIDETVILSNLASPPGGGYNINRVRVYRTQAGTTGSADFFFLLEADASVATVTDAGQEIGELLATKNWLPAPGVPRGGTVSFTEQNLHTLTPMWNGMLAGITNGAVRFCEAYVPYAWPIEYDAVPPDGRAVGLGVFGQNLLVLTTGKPILVSGSSPDSLDQAPLDIPQGCIAPRSVVSMGAGVVWASNDGLCWYGAGGARVLTAGVLLREDWLKLRPETIIGQMYEGLYFGSYEPAPGAPRKGFMVDPSGGAGIFFLSEGFDAAHFDSSQDQLYVLRGTRILKWDAAESFMSATFRSKTFRQPKPTTFSCAEVVASAYPVRLTVLADGVERFSAEVHSREPLRLPAGFRAMDWAIEVQCTGTAAIQAVILAGSIQELATV